MHQFLIFLDILVNMNLTWSGYRNVIKRINKRSLTERPLSTSTTFDRMAWTSTINEIRYKLKKKILGYKWNSHKMFNRSKVHLHTFSLFWKWGWSSYLGHKIINHVLKCVKELPKTISKLPTIWQKQSWKTSMQSWLSLPFFGSMSTGNVLTYFAMIPRALVDFPCIRHCLRKSWRWGGRSWVWLG